MQKQSLVIQGYQTEESSPKMKLKEGRLTKKIMKRSFHFRMICSHDF